jgi:hypothetical protein
MPGLTTIFARLRLGSGGVELFIASLSLFLLDLVHARARVPGRRKQQEQKQETQQDRKLDGVGMSEERQGGGTHFEFDKRSASKLRAPPAQDVPFHICPAQSVGAPVTVSGARVHI